MDLMFSGHFSQDEPDVFTPLRDVLLNRDYYMHLADIASYAEAGDRLRTLYAVRDKWARKAIVNVVGAGRFSSDRTIAERAAEIYDNITSRSKARRASPSPRMLRPGFSHMDGAPCVWATRTTSSASNRRSTCSARPKGAPR
jgi:hypothetical protein